MLFLGWQHLSGRRAKGNRHVAGKGEGYPTELLPVPGIHLILTEALYSVFVSQETKTLRTEPMGFAPLDQVPSRVCVSSQQPRRSLLGVGLRRNRCPNP